MMQENIMITGGLTGREARVKSITSRYSTSDSKAQEAAKLLASGEGHLDDEEDPNAEEALKAAREALDTFKAMKHAIGTADATRLLALATKAKGESAEAERLAKSGMSDFKAGDKGAHAIMMLAFAEVSLDRSDRESIGNEEAAIHASEAAQTLQGADNRMGALSHIAVAKIQLVRRLPKEALQAANTAVELAQASGDAVVAAKALHELGEANIQSEEVNHVKNGMKNGIQAFKNALALYKDLGMKAMAGYELRTIAQSMLKCLYKPKTVNQMAHEAFDIFKELDKPKAAVTCLELLVQASVKYRDFETAGKDAFEGVFHFKKLDAKGRELAKAWACMTEVHIAEGKAETAVEAIGNAVNIAKDRDDKALLLAVLKLKGTAQCANRLFSDATSTLTEARDLAKELNNAREEASVLGCDIQVGIASEDIEKAVEAAEDQREIYRTLGLKSEESGALLTAAACLADKTADTAQIQRALTRAKEARTLAQQAKDPKAEGAALLLVAELSRKMESEDEALEASNDMLKVLKHVPQAEKAQGGACSQLARSYVDMGLYEEAIQNADQAASFAKRSEDPRFEAETLIMVAEVNYGVAIRQEQDTKKGVQTFHSCAAKSFQSAKLAKARCQRFNYKQLLPKALCALAEVGVVFDATLAATSAEEAQTLFADLEDELGVATAVVLQANILYHKGQNPAAKAMAERGLRLAEEAGAPDLIADAQDLIQRCSAPGAAAASTPEVSAVADVPAAPAAGASIAVVAQKTGLDPAVVTETVTRIATQSISADEDLEMDTPLMDAGLDSLSSVAFRNTLMNEIKLQLPAALMFDYPNIRQLTDYIVEKSME